MTMKYGRHGVQIASMSSPMGRSSDPDDFYGPNAGTVASGPVRTRGTPRWVDPAPSSPAPAVKFGSWFDDWWNELPEKAPAQKAADPAAVKLDETPMWSETWKKAPSQASEPGEFRIEPGRDGFRRAVRT